jgi:riboflavin synthase alpha subunit
MFTGIVETMGKVLSLKNRRLLLKPDAPLSGVQVGDSVAVDGVCLTVESVLPDRLGFRLLPETLRVTTLGRLREGDRVNLERALKVGSRLGGHLLLGHVDGFGVVERCIRHSDSATLQIRMPAGLDRLWVAKGPIAVDGVSLTAHPCEWDDGQRQTQRGIRFQVHLVAYTLANTALKYKRRGDLVNLEMDLIAKYLFGMLE